MLRMLPLISPTKRIISVKTCLIGRVKSIWLLQKWLRLVNWFHCLIRNFCFTVPLFFFVLLCNSCWVWQLNYRQWTIVFPNMISLLLNLRDLNRSYLTLRVEIINVWPVFEYRFRFFIFYSCKLDPISRTPHIDNPSSST